MIKFIVLIHYGAGETGKRLEQNLRGQFAEIEIDFYDSAGSFYKKLCKPNHGWEQEIYIVLADSRERLEKLMGLKKLLDGKRLVLILPGNEKKLLSMGHRLLPRYVSTETDNFEELSKVLEKMIEVLKAADRSSSSDSESVLHGEGRFLKRHGRKAETENENLPA